MKKELKKIALVCFTMLFTVTMFAQTQMDYWTLPPNKVDFTGTSPSSSSLPGTPSGLDYSVSNGAYDESGNLLFYVKDDSIFAATGTAVGQLSNYTDAYGAVYTDIGNEISIVPVPSSCKSFYIIYTKFAFDYDHEVQGLFYTKVSLSSTNVLTIVSNGNFIDSYGGDFLAIAVSRLSSSTRKLYAVGYGAVKSYTISSSGVSSGSTITTSISYGFPLELELSPSEDKLAWMDVYGSFVNVVTISSGIANTVSFSISGSNGYYGIEFIDDNTVYISVESGTTANSGIYKLIIGSGGGTVGTKTQITSGHYGKTHIEKARDGYVYAVDDNSSPAGILGKIDPSTGTVYSSGLSNAVLSTARAGVSPYYGFYRLPDQVDGENYDYFFGVSKLTGSYTLNGSAVSPTSAIDTYTCGSIVMTPTVSGVTGYSILMRGSDASGNIAPGGYYYNSGIITTGVPSTIDIKALDGNYLATGTGYYRVELYVQNTCTSIFYVGLIRNNTISPAYSNFKINDGNGSSFSPDHVLPGTNTSAYGTTLSGNYSTGYVATYQITVDEVDCSTGSVVTSNIVNTPATNVTNGDPSTITAVSFNSKSSPLGYFSSHAGCYKVTYTVANVCGSNAQYGYFNSDYTVWRLGDNSSDQAGSVYPNPVKDMATVSFHANSTTVVTLSLLNLQGGNTYLLARDQPVNQGDNYISFDAQSIPAGVYLYQINDDSNTLQSGKIVITK